LRKDMRPPAQSGCRVRRDTIPKPGDVFIRQWRGNEWIIPRVMSRHPVADDGGELPDLHAETPVFPWSETNRVFIEPNLRMFRPGIEATIETRLGKSIEMRTELRVEKQT